MGIAEDLKSLQDLHEKGQITDAEYSTAKGSVLKTERQESAALKTGRFVGRRAIPLLFLFIVLFAFIWYRTGTKQTSQMLATAVHAPIQLVNEIENVPANSWKAIPFTATYAGSVTINLRVVHGNPLDVFVTKTDQLENMKSGAWQSVLVYNDFNAQKTQVYERTGRLSQGGYYVVLRDTSLGILSAPASDISVNVQLKP